MRNRIWADLSEVIFYNYYLIDFITLKKRCLDIVEIGSFVFSIATMICWYKIPEKYFIWFWILVVIKLLYFFRSKFFVSRQELAILRIVNNFYIDQKTELENLWYDYINENLTEKEAETKFKFVQAKETNMIKILDHKKVSNIDKLNESASKKRNKYLNRFL